MRQYLSFAVLFLSLSASVQAEVVTKDLAYKDGDTALTATLAYDNAQTGKKPGILLVHEWWGKNDYAISRAKQIAALGYTVLAVDMYGSGKVTNKPEEAKEFSKPFYTSRELMRSRAEKGLELLKSQAHVDPTKVTALGYCFGGTVALELARSGVPLQSVVVFHGGLATPDENDNGKIKEPVLVMMGEDDPFVPPAERDAFKASLAKFKVPLTYVSYPGAVHAFTNPDVDAIKLDGAKYNKAADEKSWEEMKSFLTKTLY